MITPVIDVVDLSMSYGSGDQLKEVFYGLEFSVGRGEVVCIVGPSGVGKTTLLRCLSGHIPPKTGTVSIHGHPVVGPPKEIGYVFQDYGRSLLPWFSALENVALPLRKRLGRRARREKAAQALADVGLADSGKSYPWQMSGGMQQRVAIARAIAFEPEAFVMDEPFASVDAQTRAELEDLTLSLRDSLGISVLLVTHDIDEAVYLSDRVVVLSGKPASVAEVVDIQLPRERDQVDTKLLPAFAEYRAHILRLIQAHNRGV